MNKILILILCYMASSTIRAEHPLLTGKYIGDNPIAASSKCRLSVDLEKEILLISHNNGEKYYSVMDNVGKGPTKDSIRFYKYYPNAGNQCRRLSMCTSEDIEIYVDIQFDNSRSPLNYNVLTPEENRIVMKCNNLRPLEE